jgi:protocatechuate 3,4-dioxygenase beta subunit
MRHRTLPLVLLLFSLPVALAQTPATQPAERLTGQVLSAAGMPLPNATLLALSSPGGDDSLLATAAADAAGRFSFTPPSPARDLFAFLPNVGFAPMHIAPFDEPLTFRLAPAIDCEVSVQLPDGSPAAGIPVRPTLILFPDPGSPIGRPAFLPPAISRRLAVNTDAAGHALFHGLPKSAIVRFDIDDPRFATIPPMSQSALEGDPALIRIALPRLVPGASISGRLLDPETHKPLANVMVGASSHTAGYGHVATDAQGNFTITRLPPGDYAVTARDISPVWVAPPLDLSLTAGQQATAELQLSHGATLRAQVLDAQTNDPVTGAIVGNYTYAHPNAGSILTSAVVDAHGRAQFHVPPGIQTPYIMSMPGDYLRPPQAGMQTLTLAEGQTADVTIPLSPDPAPIIEGVVLGPDNQPLPKAAVTIQTGDIFGSRQATADKEGRFHLRANPGTPLRASFKELATPQPLPAVAGKAMTLRLEKKITFTLGVTLVDEDNHPVPGATLELLTMQGGFGIGSPPHPADKNGVAHIENLPVDGNYSISGTAPGFGVSQQAVHQLPKGNPYDTVLVLHAESSEIAGTVVDGAGHPLPNITVYLNGGNTGYKTTTTDAQGRFAFPVVAGGEGLVYLLDAQRQATQTANGRAGYTNLRFTTSAAATQP